jgi:ketosteroid isomerase-like protein
MRHALLILILLLSTLPFLLSANAPPLNEPAEGDVPEIRALLDRQVADWNRKDLDGFLAGYWDSPKVVFLSGGERSEGFAAMRDRYRRNYQADGKEMGTLKFSGVEVERLGTDSAFARGRWELTKSDGTHPGGLFTLILKKLPEGWRIVHDHTSSSTK